MAGNNLSLIQDSDNERQQRPIKCGIQALQYSKETYRSMDCLVDIPTLRRL